jgi:FMN-dependent NADH-azoreductase
MTPYLKRVFGDVWGLDLVTAEAELTLAETTPAMAELRELAKQQFADAHSRATTHGIDIARRLRVAA